MKIYIAKDWTGVYAFKNVPKLMQCGGLPPIWSGHKLKELSTTVEKLQKSIPKNEYIERELFWTVIRLKQ